MGLVISRIIIFLLTLYLKLIWKACLFTCVCTYSCMKLVLCVCKYDGTVNSFPKAKNIDNKVMVIDLRKSLILERILNYLTVPDLLECSLVNRFWQDRSRFVLRNHKGCRITLGNIPVCPELLRLNNALAESTNLPFNGLCLKFLNTTPMHCNKFCSTFNYENVGALYPFVLKKLPVTHLTIDYLHKQICAGETFLRKLLISRASKETEYLEITQLPRSISSLWDYLQIPIPIKTYHYPSKITGLHRGNCLESLTTCKIDLKEQRALKIIWEIICSAPQLRHIYGMKPPGMLLEGTNFIGSHIRPGKRQTNYQPLRSLNVAYPHQLFWIVETDTQPELEDLRLWPTVLPSSADNNEDYKIKKYLSTIAQWNRTTLKLIRSHEATHLLPLIINQGPFLRLHVLLLEFNVNYRTFESNILLLQTIDYTHFLPNLTSLYLSVAKRQILIEESVTKRGLMDDSLVQLSAKYKCMTVRKLKLDWYCDDKNNNNYKEQRKLWVQLAIVFPNVKSFALSAHGNDWKIWKELYKPWKDLESVSCIFYDEKLMFLSFLVILLEHVTCNHKRSVPELSIADCTNVRKWSYPASKVAFCGITRVTNISIRLIHQYPCKPVVANTGRWKERFNKIASWIETQFPFFTLRVSFDSCGKFCNPVYFHSGPIDKELSDDFPFFHSFQNNWILSF